MVRDKGRRNTEILFDAPRIAERRGKPPWQLRSKTGGSGSEIELHKLSIIAFLQREKRPEGHPSSDLDDGRRQRWPKGVAFRYSSECRSRSLFYSTKMATLRVHIQTILCSIIYLMKQGRRLETAQ
jgi:hypothetical protein